MAFRPLSGVGGVPTDTGPYEGLPDHLRTAIFLWAQQSLWRSGFDTDLALRALTNLRLGLPRGQVNQRSTVQQAFWGVIEADADRLLQLVHFLVFNHARQITSQGDFDGGSTASLGRLEDLLEDGGSVWTIARDASGLTRRVDAAARAQFDEAVSSGDVASAELQEAWANAYNFSPNPSDAWDHCIKALEALLKPIVVPNVPAATLGHVVGEFTANRATRGFTLSDNGQKNLTDSHDTLVGLLRLVWPNSDRHQGGHSRVPSVDEARGVLAATLTIAQWARGGLIR